MAHISSGVEQALHCLLYLVGRSELDAPSVRDVAEFQGVSYSFVAKLFTTLQKAGIVVSTTGVRGGFSLSRDAGTISVREVVEAIDGRKPLFHCRNIRTQCVLFTDSVPAAARQGTCDIHAIMLEAEAAMSGVLEKYTLADLSRSVGEKLPVRILEQGQQWFEDRARKRTQKLQKGDGR